MELITRSIFVICMTMILFVVAYGILRGISSINQGYSWEEMEYILGCCQMILGGGLLVDEALATTKIIMGLNKK